MSIHIKNECSTSIFIGIETVQKWSLHEVSMVMDVWQGVAMDSLKYQSGLPCLILLRPAGGPPLMGCSLLQ